MKRNLKKNLLIYISILVLLFIIASIITIDKLNQKRVRKLHNQMEIISSDLSRITEKYKRVGEYILKSGLLSNFIIKGKNKSYSLMTTFFEDLKKVSDISIIYIMDKKGNVIFSTTYNKNKTLLGHNYSFRPYFKEALKNKSVIYIARGVTTGKRGIYYSFPICKKNRINPDMVLVIKKNFKEFDDILKYYSKKFDYVLGIISDKGIIFSATEENLLWKNIISKDIMGKMNNEISESKYIKMILGENNKKVIFPKYFYNFHLHNFIIPGWKLFALQKFDFYEIGLVILIYFLLLSIFILFLYYIYRKRSYIQKIRMLSTAIEQSKALIMITDTDGNIEYVNPAVQELTGYRTEDIIGKNPRILKSGRQDERFYKKLWETISSGHTWEGEFYNKRKDGTYYWEKAIITPLKNKHNKIIKYIAIKDNITKLKEIEEKLIIEKHRAEEANKLKSIFLSNVTHELRTPLNAILGFTEILYEEEQDKEKKKQINIIKSSGEHLLQIINDILDISKIEKGDFIKLNKFTFNLKILLNSLINELNPLIKKKGLYLNLNVDDNIPELFIGDPTRIRQIVINLINNSIKFTDRGGITLNCNYTDDQVIIEISDTGIGIPENRLDDIFKPFMQVNEGKALSVEGTGLGLSITKKLVNMMNGKIEVKSKVDKGTTFIIKLPLDVAKEEIAPVKSIPKESVKKTHKKHILIVDDIKFNILLIQEFLKDEDVIIDTALNGKEALEKIYNIDYDVVLLDLKMPVMNGFEVLKTLRSNDKYKDLNVIMLTATTFKDDVEKIFAVGATDYISKPVTKDILIKKIFDV